jgi:hypothetical protein
MNNPSYVPPTSYDQDFGEIQTEEEKRRMGLLLLPDQTRRPLGAMLPPTRQQVQAREIQPNLQSPDDMLREIARSEQQAMAQIQNLPEQQRAAAIAQLQAGTQEQKAKIMSQVQGANQNAIMATDERNANELSRVDGANVSLAGKYQDQLFKTLAVQDASQRALDEQAIQTQVGNYGYVQKRNDLNMAYGDTYMDEFGNIVVDKTKMPDYQRPMGTVTPKAKKPGVGRSGGRFKKS